MADIDAYDYLERQLEEKAKAGDAPAGGAAPAEPAVEAKTPGSANGDAERWGGCGGLGLRAR